MTEKGNIRPSRTASGVALFGGIVVVLFGAIVFLPHLRDAPPEAKLFFVIWFLFGIGMIVYHLINATGGNVPPGEVVDIESQQTAPKTPKERLTELEELKQSGLITQEEFQHKRDEIVREL